MKKNKKLISYLLPFTVIIVIPILIMIFTKFSANSSVFQIILGILILIIGLSVLVSTVRILETYGHGTLAPWNKTQTLVVKGPYKYIRNPMILSVISMVIGIWLITWNQWILVWAIIFFIGHTIYFKLSEEKGLINRFGQQYLDYKSKVPMWFPKINMK